MAECELIAFLQLRGSVVVSLDCSGERGVWQLCWCSPWSQALGDELRGCSGKVMAMEGAAALAVICREIFGQKETSSPWEGVWHGCSVSPAAIAYGEGQALCLQPGKGGGCWHAPFLPQKDAESLLQRLLLLLNFPVFPSLPQWDWWRQLRLLFSSSLTFLSLFSLALLFLSLSGS